MPNSGHHTPLKKRMPRTKSIRRKSLRISEYPAGWSRDQIHAHYASFQKGVAINKNKSTIRLHPNIHQEEKRANRLNTKARGRKKYHLFGRNHSTWISFSLALMGLTLLPFMVRRTGQQSTPIDPDFLAWLHEIFNDI